MFILSSAHALNLDKSKYLSFGKVLKMLTCTFSLQIHYFTLYETTKFWTDEIESICRREIKCC